MPDIKARAAALHVGAVERRVFGVKLEVRKQADGKATLHGYASVTETPYDMYDAYGTYSEVITRGAFAKTLSESPKVQLLVNHAGMSLSATTSGNLKLAEDETGLDFEAIVNTARNDARDLVLAVEDGDIDECSFAFRVVRQMWSPDYEERRIDEVNLNRGDVSVVNLGANPATSVALRTADAMRYLEHMEGDELRAAFARMSARVAELEPAPVMSLKFAKAERGLAL